MEGSTRAARILVFAPSYAPAVKAGGPARSITNLVDALSADHRIDVVARDRDLGDTTPFPNLSGRKVSKARTTVYYLDDSSPRQWLSLLRRLSGRDYDLIVINGVWAHKFALLPAVLKKIGVLRGPLLLIPRGELEPGALAIKPTKKRIFKPVFREVYGKSVDLFGATSESESANLAAWFPSTSVVTTTNNLPDHIAWGRPSTYGGPLRLLFLSRINPKKGLAPLLDGLSRVTSVCRLEIVGPVDDPGYWGECRRRIAELPKHVEVRYRGVSQRHEIPNLLWESDCMVLLTAGENYGHVIAEALQAGCPVITTPTTPWTGVIKRGGGEIVEDRDNGTDVAALIDHWGCKPPDELMRARECAREAFNDFAASAGENIVELALSLNPPL